MSIFATQDAARSYEEHHGSTAVFRLNADGFNPAETVCCASVKNGVSADVSAGIHLRGERIECGNCFIGDTGETGMGIRLLDGAL